MILEFAKRWIKDFWGIFTHELKQIFSDGGVLIIFFVAGFGYPILYNLLYRNGVLSDTPIAIVDESNCSLSRRYIREMDATREIKIAAQCATMEEAKELFKNREVNGIVYFPSDFGDKVERLETSTISIYGDMSSFLYYKNLMMGANFVMLNEIGKIQIERYAAMGYTDQESSQLVQAIPYEENNPYNRTFSYSIFLLSAIVLLIVQQTMFYGMSLLAGTMREEHRNYATLPNHLEGIGVGRVVLGRGAAYWLVYWGIAIYNAFIVPAMFGIPQRGQFWDIMVLIFFFLTACVFFCEAWSSLITKRETVFVLLLFISPIALFLTGFSWPTSAFPRFWKWFSYLFPSTFGCRAFINLNTAGGDLSIARYSIMCLTVQSIVYYFLSCVSIYVENWIIKNRHKIIVKRDSLAKRLGHDLEHTSYIIGGEKSAEEYRQRINRS
ncbi:MAG: ABC transporter permease [Bacteroidales bacterium]|nr:ABC transporter permease [Bacteroidales bacterium]